MDIATISGAYEGLKASKQLLTALFDAKVDAEARPRIQAALEQLSSAQDAIFHLRDELFRLQSENESLKKDLSSHASWETCASKYELASTAGGAIVYNFKSHPEHFACPSCMNLKQIQILQDNRTASGKFRCTACSAEYPIQPREKPAPLNYPKL